MSSSAPNGSSSSSARGCSTRARAIETRWRMPPDSCAGRARSKPPRPTSATRSAIRPGAGLAPATSRGSRMLASTDRQGQQRAVLEGDAELVPRHQFSRRLPVHQRPPGIRPLQPGQDPQRRRLAAARGAEQRQEAVLGGTQVEPVERRDLPAPDPECPGKAGDVDAGAGRALPGLLRRHDPAVRRSQGGARHGSGRDLRDRSRRAASCRTGSRR